jgi:hypothetical protein
MEKIDKMLSEALEKIHRDIESQWLLFLLKTEGRLRINGIGMFVLDGKRILHIEEGHLRPFMPYFSSTFIPMESDEEYEYRMKNYLKRDYLDLIWGKQTIVSGFTPNKDRVHPIQYSPDNRFDLIS